MKKFVLSIGLALFAGVASLGGSPVAAQKLTLEEALATLTPDVRAFAEAGLALTGRGAALYDQDAPRPVSDKPFYAADGTPKSLTEYRGRPVLIAFWGPWCGACQYEMESLDTLAKDYAGSELVFLPLAIPLGDRAPVSPESVKRHLDRIGLENLEALTDPAMSHFVGQDLAGTPSHVFINRDGMAISMVQGPLDWSHPKVRAYIDAFIRGEKS